MNYPKRIKRKIIKTNVDVINMSQCQQTIMNWVIDKKSKYVSTADTHVIVRSWFNNKYRKIINSSDITTPDGAPIAWAMRFFGFKNQKRLSGPDLRYYFSVQQIEFFQKYLIESKKIILTYRYIFNHPLLET